MIRLLVQIMAIAVSWSLMACSFIVAVSVAIVAWGWAFKLVAVLLS